MARWRILFGFYNYWGSNSDYYLPALEDGGWRD